jgi:hypothetical protein
MLSVPSPLRVQFQMHLREKQVPISAHGVDMKWFRYCLDFCQKYGFVHARRESLRHFLRKLEEK